jgi:hypothetical protein
MVEDRQAWGGFFGARIRVVRATRRPEFRIAVLISVLWLLFVQAYQPWRLGPGYKSNSIFQEAALFIWRIGASMAHSRPISAAAGVVSIVFLVYLCSWVIRGFQAIPPGTSLMSEAARPAVPQTPRQFWKWRLRRAKNLQASRKMVSFLAACALFFFVGTWLVVPTWHESDVDPIAEIISTFSKRQGLQAEIPPSAVSPPLPYVPRRDVETSPDNLKITASGRIPQIEAPRHGLSSTVSGLHDLPAQPKGRMELADPCSIDVPADDQHRPRNGEEFEAQQTGEGHGKLTVTNGNSEDAAVIVSNTLADSGDRIMYVRKKMTATMDRISPGEYRMTFQIGKDWDEEAEKFRCVMATSVFDRSASFKENETEKGVQYSAVRVTLHKLVGGNARTTPVDSKVFSRRKRTGK